MNFNFQLCQEPTIDKRLREALYNAFGASRTRIEALSPDAIVLTGSLSRGEGSVVCNNGALHLNSDIEAFFVHQSLWSQDKISVIKDLSEEINNHLKGQNVFCKVEFAPILWGSFLRFKPTIFAFELKTMGKVLWGDGSALSLIKPFPSSDIPKWDAFDLVNNRIIEHLTAFQDILYGQSTDIQQQEQAAYSLIKMYIDMATALLVFLGQYEPTYKARARRFHNVGRHLQNTPLEPCLPGLIEMVERCTDFKLYQRSSARDFFRHIDSSGPVESNYGFNFYNQLLLKEWEKLSLYVKPIWIWMANKTTQGDYTEDIYALASRILRQEPLIKRFRGWARLCVGLKRANRLSELQFNRLLNGLTLGSPEGIIRCLGAMLYLHIHKLKGTRSTDKETLSYIKRKLPYCYANYSVHEVTPSQLIKEIGYNYIKFARFNYALKPKDSLKLQGGVSNE